MKINVPYEIGDPILVLEFNQHDGWYIDAQTFQYSDLARLDKVFKTRKEAEEALKKAETCSTCQEYDNGRCRYWDIYVDKCDHTECYVSQKRNKK